MVSESATSELLSCMIHIQGADYLWTQEDGLDPAVVLTVERFIWREARRYTATAARSGLSVEDLVQEGQHGALIAARKFDPVRGKRYITYAAWWIHARILDALRKHLVHIPNEVSRSMCQGGGLPSVSSLDLPYLEDGSTIAENLAGDHTEATAEALVAALEVRRLIQHLQPRERHILIRRYGLNGHPEETLDAIGKSLGVSREYIRQLQDRAEARLRKVIA